AAGIPLPSGKSGGLGSPEEIQKLPEPVHGIVQDAFTNAMEAVFLVGVPVAVIGFIAVLALKELPLRGSAGRGKPAAQPPDGTRAATATSPTPGGPPSPRPTRRRTRGTRRSRPGVSPTGP